MLHSVQHDKAKVLLRQLTDQHDKTNYSYYVISYTLASAYFVFFENFSVKVLQRSTINCQLSTKTSPSTLA